MKIIYVIIIILIGNIDSLNVKYRPNFYYAKGSNGYLNTRLKEVKNIKNVDILFLGSSHAYRGFDPRIFKEHGLTTFNLGSSAQTPAQTKVLLNRYLDRLNPKTVIYEVYPNSLTSDGVESSLDIIANDKNDFNSIIMTLKSKSIKTYNALIFGIYADLVNSFSSFKETKVKENDTYVEGGYVERKMTYHKAEEYKSATILISNNQIEDFKDNVQFIKNKNIKLLLVYAPIPKKSYDLYTNNVMYDSIMNNINTYHNFNNYMSLDDSLDFYDSNHLNSNGVKSFNEKIIQMFFDNKNR